jgi:hypothetical protein
MDSSEPCNICGADVRVRRFVDETSLAEPGPRTRLARVCTSRACPSNTGERSLGDTV